MRIEEVKQLHYGDEVFWTDPDGQCSKLLTILIVETAGEVVRVWSIDNGYLEVLAEELELMA